MRESVVALICPAKGVWTFSTLTSALLHGDRSRVQWPALEPGVPADRVRKKETKQVLLLPTSLTSGWVYLKLWFAPPCRSSVRERLGCRT